MNEVHLVYGQLPEGVRNHLQTIKNRHDMKNLKIEEEIIEGVLHRKVIATIERYDSPCFSEENY